MAETYPIPTDPRFQDLTDRRFGRLLVVGYAGRIRRMTRWFCLCECGTKRIVLAGNLKRRKGTRSCGCLQRELTSACHRDHGLSHSPEYAVWSAMIHRCSSPLDKEYKRYGGRGITVSPRWIKSFEAFLADMGHRPSPKLTIDRINNDGHYEPENCRWTTMKENSRNNRRNRMITHHGQTKCLAEWAELYHLKPQTISRRLARGWSVERAFTELV